MVANLPQDVFDAAIDCLQDDPGALGTCALVCHDWLHRSRVHRFSQIAITYPIHDDPPPPVPLPVPSALDTFRDQLEAYPHLVDHLSRLFSEASAPPPSPVRRPRDKAAWLSSLLEDDPTLSTYVQAVTVRVNRKRDEDAADVKWAPSVANHLRLAGFPHLRSLKLVRFALESFADLIPTIQGLPALDDVRCEEATFLPPPFSPAEPADAGPGDPSLRTFSLSGANDPETTLEDVDTAASDRAIYSGKAFMRSGLLRCVTSLELFHASTVVGWLPVIQSLGTQLLHVGVALHDVELGEGEALIHQSMEFPGPSDRNTVLRVYDALKACTSLRALCIRYDAEDTISVRMVSTVMPSTPDEGPAIAPFFLDEAVRLFSGPTTSVSGSGTVPTPPFPELRQIELQLVTTAHSLRDCAPACAALAGVLAGPDSYPKFSRLVVAIEEPEILGILFGDREVDEPACAQKAAAVRTGLFRPFEQTGVALEVTVTQRPGEVRS